MNDWQVKQIVSAIRDHTRAMVAAYIAFTPPDTWSSREQAMSASVEGTDALLAALSASKPTTMDDLRETALRSSERINTDLLNDRRAELSENGGGDGQSESQVANATPGREPGQGSKEAATPPLSADAAADAYGLNEYDLVTVRRDDRLRALNEQREKEGER